MTQEEFDDLKKRVAVLEKKVNMFKEENRWIEIDEDGNVIEG